MIIIISDDLSDLSIMLDRDRRQSYYYVTPCHASGAEHTGLQVCICSPARLGPAPRCRVHTSDCTIGPAGAGLGLLLTSALSAGSCSPNRQHKPVRCACFELDIFYFR